MKVISEKGLTGYILIGLTLHGLEAIFLPKYSS